MSHLLSAEAPLGAGPASPEARPAAEAARLATLQALQVMDTPPQAELDRLTRLACRLFQAPMAALTLIDAEREWCLSRCGLLPAEWPRAHGLGSRVLASAAPVVVTDAGVERLAGALNPAPPAVFYAGHPLFSRDGYLLGSFCLFDHAPRDFSADDHAALADLATLAQEHLQALELAAPSQMLGLDRKRLQQALRDSERSYHALFNNKSNGVAHLRIVIDATGKPINYCVEAVNDAYELILGIKREAIEGRLVTEAIPGIENFEFDFIAAYGKVGLEGGEWREEMHFPPTDQWLTVYAYQPRYGECIAIFSDITAQRRAEAALRESERTLRATFAHAAMGMAHVDADGHFRRANPRLLAMLGYGEAELCGRHFLDITHEADAATDFEHHQRLLAGVIGSYSLEKRCLHRDGHIVWVNLTAAAVRDERSNDERSNGVKFFVCMIEDITERKLIEAAMRRGRAQLEAVLEAIDDGIMVLDMQGNVVLRNDALARIDRFASAADMPRSQAYFTRLYELSLSDGMRLPAEEWPTARVLRGERFHEWELQGRRIDTGQSWHFSYSGAPVFDEQGRQVLAVVVCRDITARRDLELELQRSRRELEFRVERRTAELRVANRALSLEQERVQAVLATAIDAYIATDERGVVSEWNRAAATMFGWSREEALGRPLGELIIPVRLRNQYLHRFRQLAESGFAAISSRPREFMVSRREGGEFPVEFSLTANQIEGHWTVSAFLRDISARKEAEAALRQAHNELTRTLAARQAALRVAESAKLKAEAAMRDAEAANRAKSEFLATMSHEIRTPLNGVIGFNGLLLDGPLTEDKRSYAEMARQSGEALLLLLNDFLDFSKIEAGRLELEPIEFDPQLEISHTLSLVRATAEQKGLPLASHIAAPSRVCGDAGRLRQILLNLLSNAIKFTETGRVELRCEEMTRREGEVWLCFEVTDTGIGIDPEARHRLFQPFVQADASTTRRFGGTGLGLAICKRLAEAMGGRIGVRSAPGEGATFWVELPFGLPAGEAGARPESMPALTAPETPSRGRVLVVEDNPVSQLMAAEMLKRLGCRVDVVGNGQEAVEAVRQLPYDLILMDCDMPVMDGFDATRAIRAQEEGRRLPIVAITASALKGDSERCLEAGMDGFLSKPIRLQDMERLVDTWLGRPDAPAEGARR